MNDKWTKQRYQEYLENLNSYKDENYKKFQQKLITTTYPIIGVRIPFLKKIAKKISKSDVISFLTLTTDSSYEEILIEGLVISELKDRDIFFKYFKDYILKIDNWAICDTVCANSKIVGKNQEYFFSEIQDLALSNHEFIARVGIVLLMNYYLNDYLIEVLELMNNIKKNDYYIEMGIAWLLSVALVKDYDKVLSYLKKNSLSKFVHNKTIQKARESFRISQEQKDELNQLKRK